MDLNLPDLLASRRTRRHGWALFDDVLYDMCKAHPRHSKADVVNAKVGIIARAYATGIERKIPSDGTQGSSLANLTSFVAKHGREVDVALAPLRRFAEPLSAKSLKIIVEQHGRLVNMLRPLLRDQQSSRSFWSKYMHFHCPVVPVYDSYVARAIPSHIRWSSDLEVFTPDPPFDDAYCWYAMRFFRLYGLVKEVRPEFSVKDIDYYLLGAGVARAE
jgi:phage-related protein